DRYVGASPSERRAALERAVAVNEAWRVLRDPIARAEALLVLRGVEVREGTEPKSSPEFLMEMLERREALAEARQGKDLGAVRKIAGEIEALARSTKDDLSRGFAAGAANELRGKLGELRYYRRLLDEVSAIEDELAA
ncbi:MAG: Fe-S protein assembly co-chaperone HscB, partial [Polyangiaceae bacterium]